MNGKEVERQKIDINFFYYVKTIFIALFFFTFPHFLDLTKGYLAN